MTRFVKKGEIKNNWLLIDAENAIVGRLAAYISKALRGKNKNQYTPHMDNGDFVVVTNIEKIKFTGKKFNNNYSNNEYYITFLISPCTFSTYKLHTTKRVTLEINLINSK